MADDKRNVQCKNYREDGEEATKNVVTNDLGTEAQSYIVHYREEKSITIIMMNYQYNNSGGSINDGGGPPSSKKKKQKSSSNKKPINRACKECHQSKNKCEYTTNGEKRCDRCIRLKRECVPHQSRQGQRKQRSSASSTVDSSGNVSSGGGDETMEDTNIINNNNNINMYNNQGNILLDNNRVESSVVNNGSIILQPPSLPQVPSQQQQQALPQQNLNSSESSSASILLKCLSMNNNGNNSISSGGSSGANHNNTSSMDYNSMLSNLDPATLNLMIRQLSSSSSSNNNALTATNNNNLMNILSSATTNNNVSNASVVGVGSTTHHHQQQQQQHQQQHHQQQQQLNNLAYGVGVSGDPTSCSNYPASALLMLAGAGSHLTAVAPQQGSNNTPILNNNNLSHTTTNTNLHLHTTTNNNFNNTNHNNNPGGSSGIGIGVGINSILNTSGLMGGTNNDIISTGLLLGGGGGGVGGGGRRSSDGDQPSSSSAANMAASSSLSTRHHIGKRATICSSTPTSGGIIESLHTTNNTNTNNATILCNTVGNKHGISQQGGAIASSTSVGGGGGIVSESVLKKQKKAHLLPLTTTTEQQYQHQPAAHYQYPSISLMSHIPSTENLTSLSDVAASAMMVARQSELGSESINVSRNNNGNDNSNGNSTTTNNIMSRNSSTQNFVTPEDAIGKEIGRAISKNSGKSLQNLKNHYGLQCQIREWISMALTRRSFALLGKASSLANRCGIHMDRILCGVNDDHDDDDDDNNGYVNISVSGGNDQSLSPPQRMNYLLATLLEPRARQTLPVKERFMLKPNLPKEFLSIVGCQNNPSFHDHNLRNRWIIIRETHKGITSFYCSPAFERNVLCWTHISQIYEDNLADINSLIFVKDDFRKFLACNAHQISAHSKEGMPPCPVHAPKTRIRLLGRQWGQASYTDPSMSSGYITKEMIRNVQDLGNVKTCEMDLRFVSFPTMDKTTYYLEFFHHSGDGSSSSMGSGTASGLSSWARNMSNDSLLTKTGATATATAADDTAGAAGSSTINVAQQPPQQQQQHQQQTEQIVSESPGTEEPPTFDDIIGCEELGEEWVGINDIVASGDIDDLITALLD